MSQDRDVLAFERIVFFSDAVYAIAITLLVIEIKVPELPFSASEGQILEALAHLIPKLVGFVVSFFLIGQLWVEHHKMFRLLASWDPGLLWRNLFLLSCVAFLPFPTGLFSEYPLARLPLILYCLTVMLAGFAKIRLWSYATRGRRLLAADADPEAVESIHRRSWAAPAVFALVAALAALGVPMAYLAIPLIPLVVRLLDRRRPAAAREGGAP